MTNSGRHSLKLVSAASPSAAVRTWYPWLLSTVRSTRVICGSSSTTSTRDLSVVVLVVAIVIGISFSCKLFHRQNRGRRTLGVRRVERRRQRHRYRRPAAVERIHPNPPGLCLDQT